MGAVDRLIVTAQSAIKQPESSKVTSSAVASADVDSATPDLAAPAFQPFPAAAEELVQHARVLAETVRRQSLTGASRSSSEETDSGGQRSSSASCFRWRDGILVEALERGDWVLLDGANLCSARLVFCVHVCSFVCAVFVGSCACGRYLVCLIYFVLSFFWYNFSFFVVVPYYVYTRMYFACPICT